MVKLRYDEMKSLFDRYGFYTLESLGILMSQADVSSEVYMAYNTIYAKKFNENRAEFEGMNEYTESCFIDNFDISEITDSLDSLTEDELDFFKELICKGKQLVASRIIVENVTNFMTRYNEVVLEPSSLPIASEGFNDAELDKFLGKFSLNDLDLLSTVLKNNYDYNISAIAASFRRVYDDKLAKQESYRAGEHKLSELKKKLSSLTEKELDLLDLLVSSASMCLSSNPDIGYESEVEDLADLEMAIDKISAEKNKQLELKNKNNANNIVKDL